MVHHNVWMVCDWQVKLLTDEWLRILSTSSSGRLMKPAGGESPNALRRSAIKGLSMPLLIWISNSRSLVTDFILLSPERSLAARYSLPVRRPAWLLVMHSRPYQIECYKQLASSQEEACSARCQGLLLDAIRQSRR